MIAFIAAIGVAGGASMWSLAVPRRMRPEASAPLLMALAVVAAAAAVWAVMLVAGANIAQLHGVAERLEFCHPALVSHRDSLGPVGYVAIALLAASVFSGGRVWRRNHRVRADRHAPELTVLAVDEPMAYAVPGRPGQVVVTTGLLRRLEPAERRVVLAHERAHVDLRHYRYLRAVQLSAAVFPATAPLVQRVRFATERWADEVAARQLGDRALVAQAVVHAAELRAHADPGLGIAATGVVERVQALLRPPPPRTVLLEGVLASGLVVGTGLLAASVFNVHHWLTALLGFCN